MRIEVLKCKIHLATVTSTDIDYEGSIAIDEKLIKAAKLHPFERVDIYNCTNGNRFSTYVIVGQDGEISLNGAAARLVHRGDTVIIASYASIEESEAANHKPTIVFVDKKNAVKPNPSSELHSVPA